MGAAAEPRPAPELAPWDPAPEPSVVPSPHGDLGHASGRFVWGLVAPGGGQFALNEPLKGTLYFLGTLAAPFIGYALGSLLINAIVPKGDGAAVVLPIDIPLMAAIVLPLLTWETALLDAVVTDMRRDVPQKTPGLDPYAWRPAEVNTL
jgi:hypothetical protein